MGWLKTLCDFWRLILNRSVWAITSQLEILKGTSSQGTISPIERGLLIHCIDCYEKHCEKLVIPLKIKKSFYFLSNFEKKNV